MGVALPAISDRLDMLRRVSVLKPVELASPEQAVEELLQVYADILEAVEEARRKVEEQAAGLMDTLPARIVPSLTVEDVKKFRVKFPGVGILEIGPGKYNGLDIAPIDKLLVAYALYLLGGPASITMLSEESFDRKLNQLAFYPGRELRYHLDNALSALRSCRECGGEEKRNVMEYVEKELSEAVKVLQKLARTAKSRAAQLASSARRALGLLEEFRRQPFKYVEDGFIVFGVYHDDEEGDVPALLACGRVESGYARFVECDLYPLTGGNLVKLPMVGREPTAEKIDKVLKGETVVYIGEKAEPKQLDEAVERLVKLIAELLGRGVSQGVISLGGNPAEAIKDIARRAAAWLVAHYRWVKEGWR